MAPEQEVDYILDDCFFAAGQAVGTAKALDYEAVQWWRARYRAAFLRAMIATGNAWRDDRSRVIAVGRHLGARALHHAGIRPSIDVDAARRASEEIEAGCHMKASGNVEIWKSGN